MLLLSVAEAGGGDDSDKESEEEERVMRELYEAIGYAEGEVYEFPREVGWYIKVTVLILLRIGPQMQKQFDS